MTDEMSATDVQPSNERDDQPDRPVPPPDGEPLAGEPPAGEPAGRAGNRILSKMLDRLFAALVNGPSLNCRPHRSRQRVDLASLARLRDLPPEQVLLALIGEDRKATVKARVREPKRRANGSDAAATAQDAKASAQERAWLDQQALLAKLHAIAEDARMYEQDTGVHVLNVGFPLLSLPPGSFGSSSGRSAGRSTGRILAPVAFIPVTLTVKRGTTPSVQIACREEGVDRVRPNTALLAWLERQAGETADTSADLFADEAGEDPGREIAELVRHVCRTLGISAPAPFGDAPPTGTVAADESGESGVSTVDRPSPGGDAKPPPERALLPAPLPQPTDRDHAAEEEVIDVEVESDGDNNAPDAPASTIRLIPAPTADEAGDEPAIVFSAVLGLFPMANQGLLRDMQEMAAATADGRPLDGPVESFIRVGVSLDPPPVVAGAAPDVRAEPLPQRQREVAEERLVTAADPCQSRAVRLARTSRGLVVHGPPGTGKSQTIANIIGDHLARGLRVLFVCDKRTALDVVANRLRHLGLGKLVAIVHDPQRDQRELYRSLKQQLEDLADAATDEQAPVKLSNTDEELQRLHNELSAYRAALAKPDAQTRLSFHDLVGQWLATGTDPALRVDEAKLAGVRLKELDEAESDLREVLHRAADADFANNPLPAAVEISLPDLLSRPADWYRAALNDLAATARAADETLDEVIVPFAPGAPFAPGPELRPQADARVGFAEQVERLLQIADADTLARWAGRNLPSVQAVRARLSEATPYLQAIKAGPLDPELLATLLGSQRPLPALQQLANFRDALQKYGDAYNAWVTWVSRIRQGAPNAPFHTLARWLTADEQTFKTAHKALAAAAPAAEKAIATPLDPELYAHYRRNPFDMGQLLRWQAALDTYLPTAGSLLGFLHGSKRKAAAPATEFFGLALNAVAGRRVRDFLAGLRLRLEVYEALQKALGLAVTPGAPPQLPDDAELLGAFVEHYSTVAASADMAHDRRPRVQMPPGGRIVPITDEADLVHRLMAPELEAVTPLFAAFGLFPGPQNTTRLKNFFQGLTVRLLLQDFYQHVLGGPVAGPLMADADLENALAVHAALLDLLLRAHRDPLLGGVLDSLNHALSDAAAHMPAFLYALRQSPRRAAALEQLEQRLLGAQVFGREWLTRTSAAVRAGQPFAEQAAAFAATVDTLEGIVRVRQGLARLTPGPRSAILELLNQSAGPDEGWAALRKVVLAREVSIRFAADPLLQNVDGQRIRFGFERYRILEKLKRDLVRDTILDQWVAQQKDRLLAETGTRLNALGAELKRRLTLRGERAMRLRQVVAAGRRIEGGDPLFDLCPVWMVSPETAAQVFPREPIFDVVVFDEASQCRLEEALPVLMRGQRVVIAGDPKQLPPTRFFESAISQSEDEEPETDQELFEVQQGEVEDLLAAALGLDIEQCYLDVHYRSRNADLIGFSNEHFYGSRLQPIPGRPTGVTPRAPVTLHRADGVYDKRRNEAEAAKVCQIVRGLLARDKPPSVGIACFNLPQRDLILEKLDELADEDEAFGKRLAAARARTGAGSFEGLFVKNLENVQGDERDHIIISTTYGPDAKGRFYRRFGPLGMPGGGRRLNVLVTRARDEVHLVTSIPADAYRSLPPLEAGQTPGGTWLLFAYLQYAERLGRRYAEAGEAGRAGGGEIVLAGGGGAAAAPSDLVSLRPTRAPSPFVRAVAERLAGEHGVGSDVYWGNDGFCIDLALRHPERPREMALGVLCDAARFAPAEDPTEWDIFRTGVLESQGWRLHRLWSPHFFRDPTGTLRALLREAGRDVPGEEARRGAAARR